MQDFIDIVPIRAILDAAGVASDGRNFEDIYSDLIDLTGSGRYRQELEDAVFSYFAELHLPDSATIYDTLVLSLRAKDVIATFNWDPFLIQAYRRSATVTKSLPHLIFLHGNVAHGYCPKDAVSGVRGGVCSRCHEAFVPDRLLFPIRRKDYSTDPSISAAWAALRQSLKETLFFTIFGYGAPASDVDAIKLMTDAWGLPQDRQFEEVEIVDIRPEEDLRAAWDPFIHTHHYQCHEAITESFLFNHPRRSIEAFYNQEIVAMFIENNLVPIPSDLAALHQWFGPLVEAEVAVGA